MTRRAAFPACLAAAYLAGCTIVGPDYRAPAIDTPARFHGAPAGDAAADSDLAAWWAGFGDPMLDSLVARAIAGNLDLQTAAARIREARAGEVVAGAAGRPQVSAEASATHSRISENAVSPTGFGDDPEGPGNPSIGFPGAEFETFRIGFDAAWEIDLFGRTRRAVEAARARTEAMRWSRRDLEVSVAAEVADAYLALRSLQRRIALAEADLGRQRRFEEIVFARTEGGLVSGLDLAGQRAESERLAALIPTLEADSRGRIFAIAILVGEEPGALLDERSPAPAAPLAPPIIPVGLPSDLLRRRPDIREAERALAAATADIGVATVDLYPRFTPTAAPMLVSQALSSLLDWGSRNYSAGAGLSWPLFQGGRARGNIAAAEAREEQALLAYRATVLTALGDVEDALSRHTEEQRRIAALEAGLAAAREAEALARTRHQGGLTDLTDVLTSQGRRIDMEEQLTLSQAALARDLVALYKALGGGWTAGAEARP